MQTVTTPVVKDLVLIGGGHAHVNVLRRFAMRPVSGLRITLITRDIDTPYSGMLPGYVAGHYTFDECHIDLVPLAGLSGARLYHAEVEAIDLDQKEIQVAGRPVVRYDLLSINTGSSPRTTDVPGAEEYTLAAKPIDVFLNKWQALIERVLASTGRFRIVIVGGGAGGVELALSVQNRLQKELRTRGDQPERLDFSLVTQSECILPTHNAIARRRFIRVMNERNITLLTGLRVTEVTLSGVVTDSEKVIPSDAVIWVTDAEAPTWPSAAGLAVDAFGFIKVNECLQSVSHAEVFVAGDIASLTDPRPKSGVFAVRQGPILAENLRRAALGQRLRRYRPQARFLSLISTGNQYAIASRGLLSWEGAWVWKLKDWIDRRFMRMYNELPEMPSEDNPLFHSGIADAQAIEELSTMAMRCGGCGAKVGATVLSRVMERLPVSCRDDVLIGRDAPDDCAMLQVPAGQVMVQSVDYFRAFITDSYLFGAIAANHALGDLYAMGAEPQSALAIATVPYGRERVVEEALYELLAGAISMLEPAGAVLAGGHSSEGAELAFGLSVNGLIEPQKAWRKSGLQPGDALILTKPIGTGTLFAAAMRGKAKGRWIDAAIESMLVSSQSAARCIQDFGATACTDLTGFGLIGHLIEMTRASKVDAQLYTSQLPLLEGAEDTVAAGILSSLQPQNLRLRRAVRNPDKAARHSVFPLLFDPQTAGGLLAGIPASQASDCINALHKSGYTNACIIGKITEASDALEPISIVH